MISRSTICTNTGQGQVLADWLTANAAAYFDSVVYDSTANSVICYVGQLAFLTLKPDAMAANNAVTMKNAGNQTTAQRLVNCYAYVATGYTCTNGIFLSTFASDYNGYAPQIMITKDESGDTAAAILNPTSSRGNTAFIAGQQFYAASSADTGAINAGGFIGSPYNAGVTMKTAFCPVVSTCQGSPHYFPNAFLTPWNQAPGTGKLTANGQDYLTNGVLAIKD